MALENFKNSWEFDEIFLISRIGYMLNDEIKTAMLNSVYWDKVYVDFEKREIWYSASLSVTLTFAVIGLAKSEGYQCDEYWDDDDK
jgi:hypothetical protein